MRAGARNHRVAGDRELRAAKYVLRQQRDDRLVGRDDGGAVEAGGQSRVIALEERPAAAREERRADRRGARVLARDPAKVVEVVHLDGGVRLPDVLDADPGVLLAEG